MLDFLIADRTIRVAILIVINIVLAAVLIHRKRSKPNGGRRPYIIGPRDRGHRRSLWG